MGRSQRTIRSLSDFVGVLEGDLSRCLRAFAAWVRQQKAMQAEAAAAGLSFVGPELFEWNARESSGKGPSRITATTDVHELGLRPSTVHACLELRIYALEDFSDLTASDLWRVPNIGRSTVLKVREMLQGVGLDFRESSNPVSREIDRARTVRASASPPPVSPGSSVGELGLKTRTTRRLLEKGIATVDKLCAQTPRDLFLIFGKAGGREVVECMSRRGLVLSGKPTDLELWKYGLRDKDQMKRPEDSAPVLELQPWLGHVARILSAAGLTTVREVRLAAAAGGVKVRGIRQSGWDAVADYFRG